MGSSITERRVTGCLLLSIETQLEASLSFDNLYLTASQQRKACGSMPFQHMNHNIDTKASIWILMLLLFYDTLLLLAFLKCDFPTILAPRPLFV